jgi:very-short-patch-repair endonuclease
MEMIPYEKSFASHDKSQYWSSKNGEIKPENVYKSSGKKYCFDCNCGHTFIKRICEISGGTWCGYCSNPPNHLCDNTECKICFDKSFASHEKSKFWSDKNKDIIPRQIFYSTSKKFWFQCDKCVHSFESPISGITNKIRGKWCPYCVNKKLCDDMDCKTCFDKSFASHEKSKYWSDKNLKKPRDVFISAFDSYLFNCYCGHEITKHLYTIANKNGWCKYCVNQGICDNVDCKMCFEKSFASHEKSNFWSNKNTKKPRDIMKNCNDIFIFDCSCGHEYNTPLKNVITGFWCGYCSNPPKYLCDNADCKKCFEKSFASHEKSKFWGDNGIIKPRDITKGSGKKFNFICNNKHPFSASLSMISGQNTWCPKCINKTEGKLFEKLNIIYPSIIIQFKQEWCKNIFYLPFDFCIPEHNIIIELDGGQHFYQVRNFKPPEKQLENDLYKQQCANDNNYSVIRLLQEDVWNDKYDWCKELCDAIEEIKRGDDVVNIYLCKNSEYDKFNL